MTLTEFLEARLAEDEAAARAVKPLGYVTDMGGRRLDEKFSHGRIRFASEDGRSCIDGDAAAYSHFARHDPARVLREVEAGRALLAALDAHPDPEQDPRYDPVDPAYGHADGMHAGLLLAVRVRAAVWSDHPDYDEAWRP